MKHLTFTNTDGLEMAYYNLADGDQSPPLILHHGYMSNADLDWHSSGIADFLSVLNRPIYAVDARGHGQSAKPHDSALYGEIKMAQDVMELADLLGFSSYDMCGFSMGGMVASRLGTMEKRLRKLVITGLGEGLVRSGGVHRAALNPEELAEGLLADDISTFSERVQNWRKIIDDRGNDRFAMAAQARAFRADPVPLADISVPTLLIVGEEDDLAPNPELVQEAIPDSILVMVPGDHGQSLLSQEYREALLAFLRK